MEMFSLVENYLRALEGVLKSEVGAPQEPFGWGYKAELH